MHRGIENLQCCNDHEIIWLKLNPPRTPCGFSCIIFGLVYYPGRTSPAESDPHILNDHLFESLTLAEAALPNCGNRLNRLNRTHPLGSWIIAQFSWDLRNESRTRKQGNPSRSGSNGTVTRHASAVILGTLTGHASHINRPASKSLKSSVI